MTVNTQEYREKQRINEYLLAYWEVKRQGRPFPLEKEIEPAELSEIWDSCFLVRYNIGVEDENEFTYLYLGSALVEAYGGDDASARDICSKLIFPSSMSLVHKFREIVKVGKPAEEISEFLNNKKLMVKYRSTMLPLADEKGVVRYIIGGMKWKAF
jgi:hypothetical protein